MMNDDELILRYTVMPILNGMVARSEERAHCAGMSDDELAREWRRARDANDGLLLDVIEAIQQDRNRR